MSDTTQSAPVKTDEQPAPDADDFGRLAALVHAFIGMMQAGGIARMDVEHGGLRLSLRAHGLPGSPIYAVAQPDGGSPRQTPPVPGDGASGADHLVRAPMIGTFYVASAPNEPAYVEVGDVVEEGQTIGIIEAMKIMNEIAADRAGTVVEILATNAQTVEYGSPLIRLAVTEPAEE